MRTKVFLVTLAAALFAATGALAGPGNGHGKIRYSFLGQLTATPSNGGVSITVAGREQAGPARDARRPGHADVRVRRHDRVPEVVARASRPSSAPATSPRATSSGCTFARRAGRRSPRSSSSPPASSATTARSSSSPTSRSISSAARSSSVGSGTVTVHVTGGNRRALKLLRRLFADQTFTFGESTIFLLWQGKVPTVIDASKLVVGDRIVVRIRAEKGSSLGQVESTPANHIGDREPAAKS